MLNWCKTVSAVLLCGTLAFAQFDDEESSSESYDYGTTESSETTEYAEDVSESSEPSEEKTVGTATAANDEWAGFNYEEIGLSQWEFQQAKEEGISRDKLTQLVEMGVRPSEYMQHPWEKLGVSEEEWLNQRTGGMEDADIDRSYRNRAGNQGYAYLSLLVPSLYQWKTDQSMKAIWMDALEVVSIGATIYLAAEKNSAWWYGLLFVAGAHVWSFADAFFSTQWDSNPDANRFSYGIIPTPAQQSAGMGVAGFLNIKF
ncbi:hypothetical protein [Fibrobacter sp. UWEL]|uniref:hypothetical protein n=1 Tax=Fibrobacter sp. UWEL TaxID=1896209 RepID=UPI0009177A50|nr:hypothetical protein [Fibrobacter sp. UWEL]SHK61731.1 hypothetical protein SAMN05720468_10464 [Fibrobacter sp. UWEL]